MGISVKEILKSNDKIHRLKTTDTLSVAISSTKGSHAGSLVFNPQGKYIGVFYPYHALYRKKPRLNMSIAPLVFNPPKFTVTSSLWDIIRAMTGYHLYTMPILDDNGNPLGILTAKTILKAIFRDTKVMTNISTNLIVSEPYVVIDTASIRDIYTSLRKSEKSRIVIVSKKDDIVGILTRRDIYTSLLSPAPGNRFGKQGGKKSVPYFDRNQTKKLDYPVKTFMTPRVNTALDSEPIPALLDAFIHSEYNSVVLVDRNNHPTGIISTRLVLMTLLDLQTVIQIPVTVVDRKNVLSHFVVRQLESSLKDFVKKVTVRLPLQRAALIIDVVKNNNHVKFYETTLDVTLVDGPNVDTRTKSFSIRRALKEVQDKFLRRMDY